MIGEVAATGKILAFVSGSGGVGRSAICAHIAAALSQQGRRVLCVDCDAEKGCLDLYLGLGQEMALSFLDICRGDYPLQSACVHPQLPLLRFLSAPVHFDSAAPCLQAFPAMIRRAADSFDYVLLDGGSLGSPGFSLAAGACDAGVLVTGFDPAALRTAHWAGQQLELLRKPARLIVNRVTTKALKTMQLTIDDVMDQVGLPLLGIVPEDPHVPLCTTGRSPFPGKQPAAAACSRIAMRIQGNTIPVSIR